MRRRPPPPRLHPSLPLAALALSIGIVAAGQGAIALGLAIAHTSPAGSWWPQPLAGLILAAAAGLALVIGRLRRDSLVPAQLPAIRRGAAALAIAAVLLCIAAGAVGLTR